MKKLIRKILREHDEDDIIKSRVGELSRKFFIVAKIIADRWDDNKFEFWAADSDLWDRRQELNKILKLVSWDPNNDEANELFWITYDNKEGLRDGTIKSYLDLKERPLLSYSIRCMEYENEYNVYDYDVLVDAYDKDDAYNIVRYDDDGQYHWWEWESAGKSTIPNGFFNKDTYESEMGDFEINGEPELVGVEDDTSRKGNLKEHIKASPVENDIISELEGLIENWDGCEEGQPIPCRYKNDVQSIIEKYKSKSLYEHTDNFTSHSDEPKIGELIVNTNPGCTHYESEGFIEHINDLPNEEGTTITYRVTNNGDTYKEGDTLTKTMDQLSPLVNEQYGGKGGPGNPVVVNEKYAHFMDLMKSSFSNEQLEELVNTDIWNLRKTEQYAKIFNIKEGTQIKQIIQFMVDKGLPEKYQEFIGENLPPIHQYEFTRTYEQTEVAIYESYITIEDTNYDSALCSAEENWWEHDPDDEHVETTDTDYLGNEEWDQIHIDGKEVWHATSFRRGREQDDDKYDPHKRGC